MRMFIITLSILIMVHSCGKKCSDKHLPGTYEGVMIITGDTSYTDSSYILDIIQVDKGNYAFSGEGFEPFEMKCKCVFAYNNITGSTNFARLFTQARKNGTFELNIEENNRVYDFFYVP